MFKILSGVLSLCFVFSVYADTNLTHFKKRFSLVKNDAGEVTYVRMNMLSNWSIVPYIKQIESDIKSEIARMKTKSYQNELDLFIEKLEDSSDKSNEVAENVMTIRRSLENFKEVKVTEVFKKLRSKGVLAKFEKELKDALMLLDLSVIASTQDARYFYKRNVTYEVVKRAIDFAKKQFDNIPLLNLASFVIVQVHEMVLEQRLFHQNMLLHYLQNVEEDTMGITVKDVDRIFSSIYESRIAVANLPESNQASENWDRYGLNKFYAMVRGANNRMRRDTRSYDEVGSRYNFGFFEAVEGGERVVKNLLVNKHMFSGKMSTAYNYDKPDEVRRFRSLLNLGQLGLGFLPIPGWLKSQVEGFIESYYVEQKRIEGALVAYFDLNGNQVMKKNIMKQLINPYILR